jgi:hypothetical protein
MVKSFVRHLMTEMGCQWYWGILPQYFLLFSDGISEPVRFMITKRGN